MGRFATSDGLGLYFEDDGTGSAVLCFAGLTHNARDFDALAPHLTDRRGRGQSDHDPDLDHAPFLSVPGAPEVARQVPERVG